MKEERGIFVLFPLFCKMKGGETLLERYKILHICLGNEEKCAIICKDQMRWYGKIKIR